MSTSNRVDTSILGWVKKEIDQTLAGAQEALRQYTETDGNVTPLRSLAGSVHQIAGTLQMVELDGAAQLARETEALASAVADGKTRATGSQSISELISNGLSRLSRYVEQLSGGQPDKAIDNVDVINRLRAARNVDALDPYSLFHPDLEVYPTKGRAPDEIDSDRYTQRVSDLRRRFQTALLGWLRDWKDETAWRAMADIVGNLYELSRFRVSMQVWWVARAYLDVLQATDLSRDDPRKHPLAKLDQAMRKLVEDGEAAIVREGEEQLVRYMLYHIGCSEVSTDTTRAVTCLFNLDVLLGKETPQPLPAQPSAFASIKKRTMEQFQTVQVALDRYARTGGPDEAFAASDQHLREIADTAREYEANELVDLSMAVHRLLFGNESGATHSEEALLAAARALILIEQALNAQQDVSARWRQDVAVVLEELKGYGFRPDAPSRAIESREIDSESLESDELHRLVSAVSGQIEENLKWAEKSLERFADAKVDTECLESIADSLRQVHGAVRMLGQHKLCDLLESALGRINALIAGDAYPSDALVDALAATIGTTDAYIKGLERDAPNIDELLDRTSKELEGAGQEGRPPDFDSVSTLKQIQASFSAWMEDNADYEAYRILCKNLRQISTLADGREQHKLKRIVQEMINLLDIVIEDPGFVSGEVEKTLRRSLSMLTELSSSRQSRPGTDTDAGARQPSMGSEMANRPEFLQSTGRLEPLRESIEVLDEPDPQPASNRDDRHIQTPLTNEEEIRTFIKETLSHIATIRSVVDDCNQHGKAGIGDELLRAAHILQDNARAVHLVELSEVYAALETTLRAKDASNAQLQKTEMDDLDALLVSTAKVLDHLNRDKRFPDVVRQQLADLTGKIESWSSEERATVYINGADTEDKQHTGSVFEELVESDHDTGSGTRLARDEVDGDVPDDGNTAASVALDDSGSAARKKADTPYTGLDNSGLENVFVEEARDILARIDSALREGHRSRLDSQLATILKRELHTLKGSSRSAGWENIGDLSHHAESMLETLPEDTSPSDDTIADMEEVHDTLANMVQGVKEDRLTVPDPRLVERLSGSLSPSSASMPYSHTPTGRLTPEESVSKAGFQKAGGVRGDKNEVPAAGSDDGAGRNASKNEPDGAGRSAIRIQSNLLDKLVNYAGEVGVSRTRLEAQLRKLKNYLDELRSNVTEFSGRIRELDVQAEKQSRPHVPREKPSESDRVSSSLEAGRYNRLQQLSRSLSEGVDDLTTIQAGLNRFATQAEGVLSQQAVLNSELQDGLMSARMVSFDTIVPRLRHQTRQTSRELSKEVNLEVTGADVCLDRNVLEQLTEAFEHMIRNAVDHGIELPEARKTAGKPERGVIRIDCRQEGDEVVLGFSDDGSGLDVDNIKTRAVEAGLLSANSDLSNREIVQLIVLSGFSTAESVTQLSGRGIGLDVVNNAARSLGGSLSMDNHPGKGLSFVLRVPLTLSVTQALFVRCGTQQFAVPLGSIESVLTTEPDNLTELSKDGNPLFRHDDRTYPVMDLNAALGLESEHSDTRVSVILAHLGESEVAVRVDKPIRTEEIVVSPLGDYLGKKSGFSGATITGDGKVVLVLDLVELWLARKQYPATG
ncbi:MAG: Chemotaxis protein CheA [Gammaproteobacteria bacterium]|nr:Chemotaxis protein CheA [Gammaproteobacteria bacterium]